jgi:hypothetical protein
VYVVVIKKSSEAAKKFLALLFTARPYRRGNKTNF